ncbi:MULTISPECIES: MFS transporter [Micromonospora]|uniref:MFS transporter n=1 Tax=Micromonospora TaxID=1873 RepID=UPI000820178A|nr:MULTISPECIES: MFS transporter [Micromonospora]TQJ22241.1 EmrB/QacA subfamily drug resistance transporter [Micromonospora sp. A202]WSK48364.1 MFS transporter [Micromonospora zamorensis]WTE88888.1 MFS transporter [Micromonospora zamorensis]SCG48477.1 drug resistance transporter, EmrB/QacA subfamily [Micromonospora zamorensis]
MPGTTSTAPGAPGAGTSTGAPHPRRWIALAVIAVSQLMVVLDATIVNIALPQAQADLGITDANRQWVITAYTLAFGGLLLLGGRIADYWGRKRTFLVGMTGFALASALGGLATTGGMLFAARALQGAFGALLAPAALALLTVLFTEATERAKAFAVYGAIAGGGSAVGLLLGGVLTEYADWRWCLLVNIPVAAIAIALALPLVPESRAHGNTRYDVPGAIVVTAGLVSLVYGFTKAAEDGWDATQTLGFIAAGVALLAIFVVIELRSNHPLLPLRIILDRNRGGAYLASTLIGAGLFGAFLFLTFYFQVVLQYKPLEAGLASLPVTVGVLIAAGGASQLMPRVGAKPLMVGGAVLAAVAMLALTQIDVDTSFLTLLLPAQVILGMGLGFTFVPLSSLALVGVPEHDAGAASATLNATQQIGGSLGTALLNTMYTSAVAAYLVGRVPNPVNQIEALVHGYRVAFAWGAALIVLAGLATLILVKVRKEDIPTGNTVHMG